MEKYLKKQIKNLTKDLKYFLNDSRNGDSTNYSIFKIRQELRELKTQLREERNNG